MIINRENIIKFWARGPEWFPRDEDIILTCGATLCFPDLATLSSEPVNDAKVNAYALDQFATTNAIKNQGFTRVCVVKHAMSAGEIIPTPDKMVCEAVR